jgi:hypothetical protein
MKKTLAALASLALIPTAAAALDVVAPHPGTVMATTYYSSGSFHGAVDLSGNCNVDTIEAPISGIRTWNFTIRTTGVVCSGGGSGNHNAVATTFSDGRVLRLWHFIKDSNSYDRTCDRCQIGVVGATGSLTGAHTHVQVDKAGTNITSWYSGYTVKGEFLDRGERMGVL